MKTIRQGTVPTPAPAPWWAGVVAECPVCGHRVELEAGDDKPVSAASTSLTLTMGRPALITVHAERHPGGKQWVEGPCPNRADGCPGQIKATNVKRPEFPGAVAGLDFNPAPAKP